MEERKISEQNWMGVCYEYYTTKDAVGTTVRIQNQSQNINTKTTHILSINIYNA